MIRVLQDNKSPVHVAAEKGLIDVVNVLTTHGASVDTMDMVRNIYHLYLKFDKCINFQRPLFEYKY